MKMRQLKLRALAGGIAAIMAMSSMVPITAQACELGYQENEAVVTVTAEYEDEATPETYETAEPETDSAEPETDEVEPETHEADGSEVPAEVADEETDDTFVSVPVEETVTTTGEDEATPEPEETVSEADAEEPETEVAEPETDEAEPETEVAEPETDEAEPETEVTAPGADAEEAEEETEVPKYRAHVVKTEVFDTELTEAKSRRTIIEYLDCGGKVITNQNIKNGKVVSETSYNTYEIEKENFDRWYAEYVEACRINEEKQIAEEEEKRAREEARRAEEDARRAEEESIRSAIEETTQNMSINELLDFYSKLSEDNVDVYARFIPSRFKDENGKVKDENLETAKSIMYPIFKNMIGGLIKSAPGSEFYGDAINGFIGGALGFNEPKTDITDIIEKGNEHLEDELVKGFAKTERDTDNYTTLKAYGATLDEMAVYAKMRAEGINTISTNKNYSELEKQVRIAELIGSSGDWYSGANQGNIMKSMEAAAEVFKGQSNVDSRDIYNVIYDINKNTSLFSGEAMDKSQGKIEKAVNGFIRNCGVVMECLRAHEAIANLTQEQIDSMDPQTREIYTRIHTDSDTISAKIRSIAGIFLGDKSAVNKAEQYGVLDKAAQYYVKNRTTYIDYGNNGEGVKLQDTLKVTNGYEYMSGDRADLNRVNSTVNSTGLNAADIDKIAYHAKANGMTITEYLDAVGFNTDNLYGYKYLMRDAYYDAADDLLGFRTGLDYEGIREYDMNSKNIKCEKAWLDSVCVGKLYGYTVDISPVSKANQNVKFVLFQKAE